MKAKDLENKPPKIIIYGGAGAGKTALVSQAKSGYLMDFDDGMRTAKTLKDKFYNLRQNIEFDIYRDKKPDNPNGWLLAKDKLLSISAEAAKGNWKYDALIIDSLSGASEVCQNQIMANAGKPLEKPTIQHWGFIVSELENFITIVRSLPVLVIITAHEMAEEIDEETKIKPFIAGKKLPQVLPQRFDEVWYAKTKRGPANSNRYLLSGRKTSSITARTRSGMNSDYDHTDTGLEGALNHIGYDYFKKGGSEKSEVLKV